MEQGDRQCSFPQLNAEDSSASYREFFELQGYRVFQTRRSIWMNVRRNIFQPAPPFDFQPSREYEAMELLRSTGAVACRWFTEAPPTMEATRSAGYSNLYVLRPPYGLDRMQSKARNQTRRGLERVEARLVTFNRTIQDQAFVVYADNTSRLGLFANKRQMTERWQKWVNALSQPTCAEFWGAWNSEQLIAFVVVIFSPHGAEIVCQRSLGSALGLYPNNVLVYRIAESAFERGAKLLSYGLGAYGASEGGLDHFKKGMGFEAIRLEDHVTWCPALRLLGPLLTARRVHSLLKMVRRCGARC